MARAYLGTLINNHPNKTLYLVCPASQKPVDKATNQSLSGTISVPPGVEIEVEGLVIPWGNEGLMEVYTDPVNAMKLVVYNDQAQSWDYIHILNKNNKELHRLDAGTMGDAPGINHSSWNLELDARGRQNLNCQWKQGLDYNAAVATIVGVCVGVPLVLLSGAILIAGAATAAVGGGLAIIGTTTASWAGGATVLAAVASIGAAGISVVGTVTGVVGGLVGTAAGVWASAAAKSPSGVTFKPTVAGTLPDLVAGKPATASSQYSPDYSADKANDGRSGGPGGWSPAADDVNSWWRVDLGTPSALDFITLFTRQDVDQPVTRQNFAIEGIYVDPNGVESTSLLGAVGSDSGPDKGALFLHVSDPTPFRYIRVRKTSPGYFFIAALQAYPRQKDLAAGKPAAASSQYSPEYAPDRANAAGNVAAGGWSPSGSDGQCFWQVDLGSPQSIARIELLTRQDMDQPESRKNFAIWASNHADMSQGHVVLGVRGATPLAYRDSLIIDVDDPTPYRYVAAVKTKPGYFFIANFAVYGRPAPRYWSYTIVSGDSLGAIAARYGCSLNDLLAANPQITNPDLIFSGQNLKIPGVPAID